MERQQTGPYKDVVNPEDLLSQKVEEFVKTKRILNEKYRRIIREKIKTPSDDIIDYCINKAWVDASIYIRTRYDKQTNKKHPAMENKEKIKKSFKEELTKLLKDPESFRNYSGWHKVLCMSKEEYGMNVGVWQKLVNMTFKYLYCFKDVPTDSDFDFDTIRWDEVHCPIDSVIAKKVLEQLEFYPDIPDQNDVFNSIANNGSGGVSWNGMNYQNYEYIQKVIDELRKKNSTPSKLYFDFIWWEKEKQ